MPRWVLDMITRDVPKERRMCSEKSDRKWLGKKKSTSHRNGYMLLTLIWGTQIPREWHSRSNGPIYNCCSSALWPELLLSGNPVSVSSPLHCSTVKNTELYHLYLWNGQIQLSSSLSVSYSGVPLIQGLDIDERDFSVCAGHHSIMLTAHNEVNVIPELPPPVPENQ